MGAMVREGMIGEGDGLREVGIGMMGMRAIGAAEGTRIEKGREKEAGIDRLETDQEINSDRDKENDNEKEIEDNAQETEKAEAEAPHLAKRNIAVNVLTLALTSIPLINPLPTETAITNAVSIAQNLPDPQLPPIPTITSTKTVEITVVAEDVEV